MFQLDSKIPLKFWPLGVLLFVFACSSSTEPEPDTVQVSFQPVESEVGTTLGDTIYFNTTRAPSGSMDVQWSADGIGVGTGEQLTYIPIVLGDSEITVSVVADGLNFSKSWDLHTASIFENNPPSIFYLNVNHSTEIGDIVLTWPRSIPTRHPISHYLVAYSSSGPITRANWSEATSLGSMAEDTGLETKTAVFGEEDGIPGGEMIWVAVVAVDEIGLQSPTPTQASITPTYAWYINGTIYNDAHQPMHQVIVDFGCPTCRVNTNQDGEFTGGPFSSNEIIDLYTVTSDAPWHAIDNFNASYDVILNGIIPSDDVNLEISLIGRYGIDNLCNLYEGDFLNFFMELTNTSRPTPGRDNRLLLKWENFPIEVFIPEHTNGFGLDMTAISLAGLELWNTIMGEEYFVLVDNFEESDIDFVFNSDNPNNGVATLTEPNGFIGDVIPEHVQVYINDSISNAQFIQEVAMHELCHAIGCADHAYCSGSGYMMYLSPSGILDGDELEAIHIDEQRLMRAVRHLPMGYDVTLIEIDP